MGVLGLIGCADVSLGQDWQVPDPAHTLSFPRDHGSHPNFKIEWWYITGHLESKGRRFGFQATFFRLGQKPGSEKPDELLGNSQLYLAHMGISDPVNKIFLHEERLNREGWNAGASVNDLDVHNANWSLKRTGKSMRLSGSVRADASWDLELIPQKGPIIFGEDGVSRKGPEGTASSYYITYPRIDALGSIRIKDESFEVTGEAWMDHEISSSQLDRSQIGWNWTCIQFNDGREIMGYVLRTADGENSPYSRLVWIGESGRLHHLTLQDYQWEHGGSWTSPESGATYPISPTITALDPKTGENRILRLQPLMPDQEMTGTAAGISYWEGACDVLDEVSGKVVGRAFLEMTGYADDIGEKLR